MGPTYGPTPGPRTRPGAKGDGGPPLRAQGPGALGPPGRGWYLRPPWPDPWPEDPGGPGAKGDPTGPPCGCILCRSRSPLAPGPRALPPSAQPSAADYGVACLAEGKDGGPLVLRPGRPGGPPRSLGP